MEKFQWRMCVMPGQTPIFSEVEKAKLQFTVFLTRRKSILKNSHDNRKIGAKKCRRLNKPVPEYRSRIVHTARTLRGRFMTHTVLIRADFDKRRFTVILLSAHSQDATLLP